MNFVLIVISLIIFVCVLLNKVSNKFGLPVLLAFLMLGIISAEIGSHTAKGFHVMADVERVCTIALIFIMFYGGFSTRLESAKPVIFPAAMLATVGVVITAGLTGLFCHWVLGWEWKEMEVIQCRSFASRMRRRGSLSIRRTARCMRWSADRRRCCEAQGGVK